MGEVDCVGDFGDFGIFVGCLDCVWVDVVVVDDWF